MIVLLDAMTPEMQRAQREGEMLFRAFFVLGEQTRHAVRLPERPRSRKGRRR